MKYKLIACDLDGTLVGSDLTVSDANKRAITELSEMGVSFVPCTGRTLSEMRETVDNPNVRYIIYSNGAAILDKKTGSSAFLGFTRDKATEIMDILSKFDCYIIVHYLGETYIDIDMTDENVVRYNISFNVKKLVGEYANKTDNLKNAVCAMDGIESITVFFKSKGDYDLLRATLGKVDGISFVDGWDLNLEIFSANTSKGKALATLSQSLDIPLSETIAVGDSGNDVSMVKAAGLGIAMSNACDELKAVANEIACSNDESVAHFILERYFCE